MTKPIVIVGLGPGGLIAALESAKKGHDVIAISNRTSYLRPQRVLLSWSSFWYLWRLLDLSNTQERKFLFRLMKEKTVELKDLERVLFNHLKQQSNVRIITDEKLTAVNTPQKEVVLKTSEGEQERIKFQHLLAADGSNHSTANLVAKTKPEAGEYEDQPLQLRHHLHGTATLQSLEPLTKKPKKLKPEHLPLLKALGWDKDFLPNLYIFPNEKNNKFYIASEMPSHIEKLAPADKKAAVLDWGRTILHLSYDEPKDSFYLKNSRKHGDAKTNLKLTAFPVTLKAAKYVATPLDHEGQHFFAQIGDAQASPNYLLGHGANDAIEGGREFAQALGKPGGLFNFKKFCKAIQSIKSKMSSKMENHANGNYFYYAAELNEVIKALHENLSEKLQTIELGEGFAGIPEKLDKLISLSRDFEEQGYFPAGEALILLNDLYPLATIRRNQELDIRLARAKAFFHFKNPFDKDLDTSIYLSPTRSVSLIERAREVHKDLEKHALFAPKKPM